MNTYLLSLQRCRHIIAFFSLDFDRTLWKYFSLRVEQTSWFYTYRSNVQFVVLFYISLTVMWTLTKTIFSTGRKFVAYSWLVSYSLFINYSLFAIPYFIRWISIKLGEYINNKGNNKITEFRTILQRENKNS